MLVDLGVGWREDLELWGTDRQFMHSSHSLTVQLVVATPPMYSSRNTPSTAAKHWQTNHAFQSSARAMPTAPEGLNRSLTRHARQHEQVHQLHTPVATVTDSCCMQRNSACGR